MMLNSLGVRIGVLIGLMAVTASSHAGFLTVENIVQCMRDNLVEGGALRQLTATTRRPDDSPRDTGIRLHWRTTADGEMELNLQVVSPPDITGIAYLLRPTDQGVKAWLYLPGLDSVREISADQLTEALWGTEFSYAQFRQLLGDLLTGDARRLADEELAGREVYVIDTRPDKRGSRHTAVRSFIDKQSCLLIRAEYRDQGDALQQVLQADPATLTSVRIGSKDLWLLSSYSMRNVTSGQQTQLQVGDIHWLDDAAMRVFSPQHFHERVDIRE